MTTPVSSVTHDVAVFCNKVEIDARFEHVRRCENDSGYAAEQSSTVAPESSEIVALSADHLTTRMRDYSR